MDDHSGTDDHRHVDDISNSGDSHSIEISDSSAAINEFGISRVLSAARWAMVMEGPSLPRHKREVMELTVKFICPRPMRLDSTSNPDMYPIYAEYLKLAMDYFSRIDLPTESNIVYGNIVKQTAEHLLAEVNLKYADFAALDRLLGQGDSEIFDQEYKATIRKYITEEHILVMKDILSESNQLIEIFNEMNPIPAPEPEENAIPSTRINVVLGVTSTSCT